MKIVSHSSLSIDFVIPINHRPEGRSGEVCTPASPRSCPARSRGPAALPARPPWPSHWAARAGRSTVRAHLKADNTAHQRSRVLAINCFI